ncbi:hypothetical protein Tco_0493973 [Tanacetum coccineum]
MLDEKPVLVDDDGMPLKKVDDPVNADSDSKVDDVLNEIVGFMASTSSKVDKSSKSGSDEWYTMNIIRVEYEWTPLRWSSCQVFGHVLDECPKKIVSVVLRNLKNHQQAVRGVLNGASSRSTKKQAELTRQESSTSNSFDALNMVENDDDLGTNEGNSKLDEKGVNFDMVSSAPGTSSKAFGSQLLPL